MFYFYTTGKNKTLFNGFDRSGDMIPLKWSVLTRVFFIHGLVKSFAWVRYLFSVYRCSLKVFKMVCCLVRVIKNEDVLSLLLVNLFKIQEILNFFIRGPRRFDRNTTYIK
jgi:hypothetical protein